jgi:hypothetical protein
VTRNRLGLSGPQFRLSHCGDVFGPEAGFCRAAEQQQQLGDASLQR